MFDDVTRACPLAFPVPALPPTVRTRSSFPFPAPLPPAPPESAGSRLAHTVSVRLAGKAPGPFSFVVGALAGCVFALCAVAMTDVLMSATRAPAAVVELDVAPHVATQGVRSLVVTKPLMASAHAPVAPAPPPEVAPAPPRKTVARTTATRRMPPKRDSNESARDKDLLSAGLAL